MAFSLLIYNIIHAFNFMLMSAALNIAKETENINRSIYERSDFSIKLNEPVH